MEPDLPRIILEHHHYQGETMAETEIIEHLRRAGAHLIHSDGKHDYQLIPFDHRNVVFRQMFEYAVTDFEAEVGFYASIFGFSTIALTSDYALFTHPQEGYCFSFRKAPDSPALSNIGLKLLFMTTDIPGTDAHLEQTGIVHEREIRKGSPVQDVIHFSTPAGVVVEIWQMPTDE